MHIFKSNFVLSYSYNYNNVFISGDVLLCYVAIVNTKKKVKPKALKFFCYLLFSHVIFLSVNIRRRRV